MPTTRRAAAALAALVLLPGGAAAGCGDGGDDPGTAAGDTAVDDTAVDDTTVEDAFAGSYPLPFGLRQVEGTEPVGRPAVVDDIPYTTNGVPVHAETVQAAYRVTADDPVAVLRAWAGQLDGLTLDGGSLREPDWSEGPWALASASGDDYVDLQLWQTEDGPILLVHVSRMTDAAPTGVVPEDELGEPADPYVVPAPERSPGDLLFSEQGDAIHLPEGTRQLMPTLPTFGGTGGSTSVLAAQDGPAAVQALVDEAVAGSEYGEASPPETTTEDDVEVVRAGFVIPAGGWGFDALSVQAPDDPEATVYVTSYAD